MKPVLLVVSCMLMVGCAAEVDSANPSSRTSADDAMSDELPSRPQDSYRKIASIRMSSTRKVDFYEVEPGSVIVHHSGNADHDRDALPIEHSDSLAQTYRDLVRDEFDPVIEHALETVDRRRQMALNGEPFDRISELDSTQETLIQTVGSTEPHAELVDKGHAGCPGPSNWDWVADSAWFFSQQPCSWREWGGSRKDCRANNSAEFMSHRAWVWDYRVLGFAQQFCNTARYTWVRQEDGFHYNVWDEVVQPRHFSDVKWMNLPYAYDLTSTISKHAGSQPDKKGLGAWWMTL